jgi:hypothetical protein
MNLNTISLTIEARPTNHRHGSIRERKDLPVLCARNHLQEVWFENKGPCHARAKCRTRLNSQLSLILGLYTILGFSSRDRLKCIAYLCENSESSDGGRLGWATYCLLITIKSRIPRLEIVASLSCPGGRGQNPITLH